MPVNLRMEFALSCCAGEGFKTIWRWESIAKMAFWKRDSEIARRGSTRNSFGTSTSVPSLQQVKKGLMATEHWIEGELYAGPRPVYCNMFWSFVARICGHGVHVHPVSRVREIWSGSEEHVFRLCVNWVVGLITNDWIIVWVGGLEPCDFTMKGTMSSGHLSNPLNTGPRAIDLLIYQ